MTCRAPLPCPPFVMDRPNSKVRYWFRCGGEEGHCPSCPLVAPQSANHVHVRAAYVVLGHSLKAFMVNTGQIETKQHTRYLFYDALFRSIRRLWCIHPWGRLPQNPCHHVHMHNVTYTPPPLVIRSARHAFHIILQTHEAVFPPQPI